MRVSPTKKRSLSPRTDNSQAGDGRIVVVLETFVALLALCRPEEKLSSLNGIDHRHLSPHGHREGEGLCK